MAERERLDASPTSYSPNSPDSDTYRSCQFLTVDETKRPRANSDPVGLHFAIANLPQITVTGDDGQESDSKEDTEVGSFLGPPAQRPRSNTCPEDLFKLRKGRPPTPPPTDIMKSPGNKKRLFSFNAKDLNGISFTHHRLCKVNEDGGEFVTKPNKKIRPSHAARRASCLAALSESPLAIDEQKDNNDEIPKLRLSQAGNSDSSDSGTSSAKPAFQNVDRNLDKEFQRININPTKSNIRSEGVDLAMSIAPPNVVTS